MKTLNVNSIFESISGEAGFFPQGTWCTFIRLQGCNLSCNWCDTQQARDPNSDKAARMEVDTIPLSCNMKHVLITGGEPLEQKDELLSLIQLLHKRGHVVQIETNGSHPIPRMYPLPGWVVDYKCLSSGMSAKMPSVETMVRESLKKTKSIVKFVIDTDYRTEAGILLDLEQAVSVIRQMTKFGYHRQFIISPGNAKGEAIRKIAKMIADPAILNRIIFSVQLHKLVGLP